MTAAGWIVLLILAVCAGLLVLAVRWFRTSDEEDARRGAELARRLGARPGRDSQGRDILELELEWRKFRLTRLWRKRGASTWVETPVEAPGFGFELQPRRALVVATIGDTLARTGDAAFEEKVLAMSSDRARLESVLTPDLRAALVEFAQSEGVRGWWWRLHEGVLRGELRGTWGAEDFDERLDAALRLCVSLARQGEANVGERLAG